MFISNSNNQSTAILSPEKYPCIPGRLYKVAYGDRSFSFERESAGGLGIYYYQSKIGEFLLLLGVKNIKELTKSELEAFYRSFFGNNRVQLEFFLIFWINGNGKKFFNVRTFPFHHPSDDRNLHIYEAELI